MVDIEARVSRLETSLRRWQVTAAGALIVGAVATLAGWTRPDTVDVVRTRSLVVTDSTGRDTLVLAGDFHGRGMLRVQTAGSTQTAGPSVTLIAFPPGWGGDRGAEAAVSVVSSPEAGARLYAEGKTRSQLRLSSGGVPRAAIGSNDAAGRGQLQIFEGNTRQTIREVLSLPE